MQYPTGDSESYRPFSLPPPKIVISTEVAQSYRAT
jgi:hypothetical protein